MKTISILKYSKRPAYALLLCAFFFIAACKNDLRDEKSTILITSTYNAWLKSNYGYNTWMPTAKDFKTLDKVLIKAIEQHEFDFIKEPIKANIDKYLYKQYIPYIDSSGDRIIYLNTFCDFDEERMERVVEKNGKYEWVPIDWKNEYFQVDDGGMCYWRITINIDKEAYSNLMINGV